MNENKGLAVQISKIFFSYALNTVIDDVKKRPGNACIVALCAVPAIEMAIRSVGNLYELVINPKDDQLSYKTAGNLIGAMLLTPCTLDAFRGARLLGAIGFIFYSEIFVADPKDRLISAGIISQTWQKARRNKIMTGIALLGMYLIYAERNQIQFSETVSKTRAIFSSVWRKV